MKLTWCRALVPVAAVFAALLPAHAQQQQPAQPQPQQNPYCSRLETQLQAFDRGGSDAARADQLRKLEEMAASQQTEIDRQQAIAQRAGCEKNSFLVLFSGQPQQCGPLNNKIQQMRDNLDRIQSDLERQKGDAAPEREGQRRAILVALAQNNCGAQYQQQIAATPPPRSGLFDSLFGPKSVFTPGSGGDAPGLSMPSGTFRTICVRTCDGYYFPISYSAAQDQFRNDEQTCQRMCPASEVALYTYHNPGEEVQQAVSLNGRLYTELPTAFNYRKAVDKTCSCRKPGENWSQALKAGGADDTIAPGDVIVTEQNAKKLSQPRIGADGKPIRPALNANTPAVDNAAAPVDAPAESEPGKRTVRTVGPTFLPVR
jgi:hypothetical protein